jgi:hypothetical protein
MITQFTFIYFVETQPGYWLCQNEKHGYILGHVEWYDPWKKYCYCPGEGQVYSIECLRDIAEFIESIPKKGK